MSDKLTRVERDSIGEMNIPVEAYYGVQSMRALENFLITGYTLRPEMINSLAEVKKACAIANLKAGQIPNNIANAIVQACDEILDGKLHDEFIVDPVQGSAGTSINMNANEVIANRAIEILGGTKGDYSIVHPNDHVNYGQSTNDVIPTAGKITVIKLGNYLIYELNALYDALMAKAEEFDDVIKMGRTQLQDAVPIRLGQEFHAYATAVKRTTANIANTLHDLYAVNMGGTAIGTGINADDYFFKIVTPELARVTGLDLYQAEDPIDGTQHIDCFPAVSGAVRTCAVALSKMCNDLRLLSSGPRCGFGEINLPAKQNGSSIMPGKVNPVIPEVVNQAAFLCIGNDVTVSMAAEAGQMELNAFEPITFYCLFSSMEVLTNAIHTLIVNCINGITANKQHCADLVNNSVGIITTLCPHIGYQHAADIAKKAIKTGAPVRDLILEEKLLTPEELDIILDPWNMTKPGISGEELLNKK